MTTTQIPLILPPGEYQPQLLPVYGSSAVRFPSLPAPASVPPVRGLGVGQGSGGPCNTATLSHGWDFSTNFDQFLTKSARSILVK